MDSETKAHLILQTKPLLEGDDWSAIEQVWRSHIEGGDLDACAQVAYYYHFYGFDEGEVKNREMEEWLRSAADAGNADAAWCLAIQLEDGPERDRLLQRAGELGNRNAQRDLGALYATGDWSGPKDQALAVHWYQKAAEQGHEDARYNLGFMYILGEGVEANVDAGLRWFKLSAEQGSECAMRLLADLYRHGYYRVPIDPKAADEWEDLYSNTKRRST